MRISALLIGFALMCCLPTLASADDPLPYVAGPQVPCLHLPPNSILIGPIICKTVILRDEASLVQLKKTDPDDYAIATRVMLAASQLCTPGAPEAKIVGLDDKYVTCSATLYPSNPPKREVWFKIGHTMYRMRVAVPE